MVSQDRALEPELDHDDLILVNEQYSVLIGGLEDQVMQRPRVRGLKDRPGMDVDGPERSVHRTHAKVDECVG